MHGRAATCTLELGCATKGVGWKAAEARITLSISIRAAERSFLAFSAYEYDTLLCGVTLSLDN